MWDEQMGVQIKLLNGAVGLQINTSDEKKANC